MTIEPVATIAKPNRVSLHLKRQPAVPLEAEVISPDVMGQLSNAELRELRVYHGKRQLPLSEFFDVEGEFSQDLELHGDLHKVRWIGRAMSQGSITVHGSVGMHLGSYMSGGRIEVHGDAGLSHRGVSVVPGQARDSDGRTHPLRFRPLGLGEGGEENDSDEAEGEQQAAHGGPFGAMPCS